MKTQLFAFLLLLAASSVHAQEKIYLFDSRYTLFNELQPKLDNGWTVKHLAVTDDFFVVVLEPPPKKPAPVSATGERLPVPGGLEERRAKMLSTKPEASKP